MSDYYNEADYTLVHNEHLALMKSLLTRIYTECDERDEGKGGRFSVELMEELRQFVQKQQLEERDHG